MKTVNFSCTFCGKLMAVGLNLLGRNVRCPHCKQVVQAPATAAPGKIRSLPPSALQTISPVAPPPPKTEGEGQESIFGETHDDDLFSSRPSHGSTPSKAPPPIPSQRRPNDPAKTEPNRTRPPLPHSAGIDATIDVQPFPSDRQPWSDPGSSNARTAENEERLPAEDEPHSEKRIATRPIVRESGGGGMFVWMLLLYAVIATGIAAYLFYDKTEKEAKQPVQGDGKEHPFLAIPDFFGQYDRVERRKVTEIKGMPAANLPVPDELQIRLTETKKVGNLEITPLEVKVGEVNWFRKQPGGPDVHKKPPGPMYVLTLRLKNTSDDLIFNPTDPAFNRHARTRPEGLPIYTGISIGKEFFMGGPFPWPDSDNMFLEGQQNDDKPLAPHEERVYVIGSSNDYRPVHNALATHEGDSITWRVDLRRGLEKVMDAEGNEREISVRSVIGVVFDRNQIHE